MKISSTNCAGLTRCLTWRRMKTEPYWSPCTKLNYKWVKNLNIKLNTINLIEENFWNAIECIGLRRQVPEQNNKGLVSQINNWWTQEIKHKSTNNPFKTWIIELNCLYYYYYYYYLFIWFSIQDVLLTNYVMGFLFCSSQWNFTNNMKHILNQFITQIILQSHCKLFCYQ